MEIVVYQGLTYLPLVTLGAGSSVILAVAVLSTVVGHLIHANLNLTWGPARFLINSPRMHVWHHDLQWPASRPHGVNFGIVFSAWDWLFGTAHWPSPHEAPDLQPSHLGFPGMAEYPRGLFGRFFYPISRLW
jgi:sterol desaturase/sphingolipid hydroxylase (fatty acid hydroxylase superfamily)